MRLSLDMGLGSLASMRGGVSPATILGSSLVAEWNADRADLITLSGSQVTSWKDVVAGYDLTQAVSGSRPLYSATSYNGSPGITGDGLDDFLRLASVPLPSGAAVSEVFINASQDALATDTTVRPVIGYGGSTTAVARHVRRIVTTGVNRLRSVTGTGSAINTDGTLVDLSGRNVMHTRFGATTTSQDINGAADGSSAAVPTTGTVSTTVLADNGVTPSIFWKGTIRDLIVTTDLTAGQRSALISYLLSRRNP